MQHDHCKGCRYFWTGGTKGNWCCLFGRLAKKAVGHCKLKGGKSQKEIDNARKD